MYEDTVRHNGTQDHDNEPKTRGRPPWLPPSEIPSNYYNNLFGTQFEGEGSFSGMKKTPSQWTVGFAKQPQASRVPSVFDYTDPSVSNISAVNSSAEVPSDFQNSLKILENIDMSIYMGFPPRGLSKLASMSTDPNVPCMIKPIKRTQLQGIPDRVPFNPLNTGASYPRMGGIMEIGAPYGGGVRQSSYMPNNIQKSTKGKGGPWNIMDRYINDNNNNNNHNDNIMDPGDLSRILEVEMPKKKSKRS